MHCYRNGQAATAALMRTSSGPAEPSTVTSKSRVGQCARTHTHALASLLARPFTLDLNGLRALSIAH